MPELQSSLVAYSFGAVDKWSRSGRSRNRPSITRRRSLCRRRRRPVGWPRPQPHCQRHCSRERCVGSSSVHHAGVERVAPLEVDVGVAAEGGLREPHALLARHHACSGTEWLDRGPYHVFRNCKSNWLYEIALGFLFLLTDFIKRRRFSIRLYFNYLFQ